ncbi:thiol-dependent reductase 1 [Angomonas deanei]|uniref:Glutathione S-transferase, N-terminal domain/Glutathione S-transferase, C-terminal domain containing protein, putative n=1 Tax=Angomonas deanei TaxID=59799 RepID=A0A7G2CV79_9TRYP|nr:thiol-dependent reductase 1 [Angomonas deanei]CAD2222834.1 Glutathione S-transferase, N-terminal domain/Glutathione S-transferase, C-terminal domain containing protein, putative [Angomonas deanei]|eukprot:EPY21762.1 thiol-dependent reductase 1 [Angomonas deanei]
MSHLYKLYTNKSCPFVHRALIVIEEKKLASAIEEVFIDLTDMPKWYAEINPMETVPTLEVLHPSDAVKPHLNNGKYVYESQLIAEYLDSVSEPKEQLHGRNAKENHKVQFVSEASDLISAGYGLLRDPFNKEKRKAVEDNAAYLNRILEEGQTEEEGPFVCGSYFTLADIAITPFLIRFDALLRYYAGVDVFYQAPALRRLFLAAKKRPSVVATSLTPAEYISIYANYLPESHPWRGAVTGTEGIKPVLFYNPLSSFSDRVRLLLTTLPQVKAHLVEVDYKEVGGWYAQVNYRQTVPALLSGGERPSAVHESWPILLFLSQEYGQWAALSAEERYAMEFFNTKTQEFSTAMVRVLKQSNPSADDWEYFFWAAEEVVKELTARNAGQPAHVFHGKAELNLADFSFLPFLVRAHATLELLTEGKHDNIFEKFPILNQYLEKALAKPEIKSVFLDPSKYLTRFKTLRSQSN